MRQYHVEPFNPNIGEKQASREGSSKIAAMMAEMIQRAAAQGWTFDGYHTIETTVNPGCLNMFGGPRLVNYGVLVFSRDA